MNVAAGKTALVTGAAGGLGGATLDLLRERGWHAVGLDLRAPDGADAFVAVDVSDPAAVAGAVDAVVAEHGGLDAVAHCAGIFRNELTPLHLTSDEAWRATIDVNLTGTFHVARAVLPHLMTSRGALTLISSVGAANPQPGGSVYAASKAGVAALAGAIALEYGGHGVRCNAVCPGYMATAMAAPVLERPHLREALEREIPLQRVSDPVEVARLVAFTLSEDASYLTGQSLTADGGATLTALTTRRDLDRMWRPRE